MKKPKHDEIMLWLDSIVEKRLASWIQHELEWDPEVISKKFSDNRQDFLLLLEQRKERIEDSIKNIELELLKRTEETKEYSKFSYYESCYRERLDELESLRLLHDKASK